MSDRFPWRSHRSMAEVIETGVLLQNFKRLDSIDLLRLHELLAKAKQANPHTVRRGQPRRTMILIRFGDYCAISGMDQ